MTGILSALCALTAAILFHSHPDTAWFVMALAGVLAVLCVADEVGRLRGRR